MTLRTRSHERALFDGRRNIEEPSHIVPLAAENIGKGRLWQPTSRSAYTRCCLE